MDAPMVGVPYAVCLDLANLRPAARIEPPEGPFLGGSVFSGGVLVGIGTFSTLIVAILGDKLAIIDAKMRCLELAISYRGRMRPLLRFGASPVQMPRP